VESADFESLARSALGGCTVKMRKLVFLFLRYTGIPFLLRELVQRHYVSIVCLHDPTPEAADRIFTLLKRHYSIIPLSQYLEWRDNPDRPMPPKPMIITMDDGHRGNYLLAPVLKTHNIPVTVFLCSGIVGTHRHFWWTTVKNKAEREALKRMRDGDRLARLVQSGYAETREYEDRQALSQAEIQALKPIIDFQSHTRFHPILSKCTAERAAGEIVGSKCELEERFGVVAYALAYPNGDYSRRDLGLVQSAGYRCALTLDGGYNTLKTDPTRLRRIPLDDAADENELVVKASGLWEGLMTVARPRLPGLRKERH
jgi:peptidoglycan/xylan/chitin deacetylase (PgdA/CDA1 family)